jgi:hypothetical protein
VAHVSTTRRAFWALKHAEAETPASRRSWRGTTLENDPNVVIIEESHDHQRVNSAQR